MREQIKLGFVEEITSENDHLSTNKIHYFPIILMLSSPSLLRSELSLFELLLALSSQDGLIGPLEFQQNAGLRLLLS